MTGGAGSPAPAPLGVVPAPVPDATHAARPGHRTGSAHDRLSAPGCGPENGRARRDGDALSTCARLHRLNRRDFRFPRKSPPGLVLPLRLLRADVVHEVLRVE